ncbi:uncharacterized protein LOC129290025 [Prosopis cineraria]|uniref:uncharacterized protein LOC129290025 n=1 Tax=Prosopis cineraria TaxID=364024 RepID=UPI00240FDDF0|nr:uncharacterized protein LOC129290025 [Prosopis cineraria]
MVSVGPFHHGNQRLESMQELKLRYLNEFLKRTHELKSLDDYFDAVRGWEGQIRGCYSESIHMESDESLSMILTDACFIIELFVASFLEFELETTEDQPLLTKRWPRDDITRLQVEHLRDMLGAFYVPSINPPTRSRDTNAMVKCPYTTNQLHEARLKFEADQSKGIFQLEYSNGVVKMPIIGYNGLTEIMLRNLVGLEQCHHPLMRNFIPDHIDLLNDLISTGKDVEILIEKGIIECFS